MTQAEVETLALGDRKNHVLCRRKHNSLVEWYRERDRAVTGQDP